MQQEQIEELVDQSVQGDKKALNRLVYHIQDDIFNLSLRMLGKPEESSDATQEILIKIVTHLSGFRRESGFRTWYYRIACNYLLNERQKLSHHKNISFDEIGPILDGSLAETGFQDDREKRLLTEQVKTACTLGMLQCLTVEARLVYILGEILQIDSVTGSKMLEINSAGFRQLLSRSRKKITAFTQTYCGIVNLGANCSCANVAGRALNADIVHHAGLLKSKLDTLVDSTQNIFRQPPAFKTPAEIGREVKSMLEIDNNP